MWHGGLTHHLGACSPYPNASPRLSYTRCAPGRQLMTAQVPEFMPPTGDTGMEFLAPGFSLVQP